MELQEIDIEATVLDIDYIRLKFHGLPNDLGPDLVMDFNMVRLLIAKLQKCLPEHIAVEEPIT